MRKLLGATIVVLALTGCGTQAASVTTPTPTKVSTYYGEAASTIATKIPGCSGVQTEDLANGVAGGLSSLATCTLDGRTVTVYSWKDAETQSHVIGTFNSDNEEFYYASSEGWTAVVQYDDTLMYQLTNQADKLIAQADAGYTDAPADIPGEKSAATTIARALGGTVVHIQP